jgi:hypothetical protein
MTFEIVEGLLTILAPVERFTGGAPKLTDQGGMIGKTMRTLNGLLPVK